MFPRLPQHGSAEQSEEFLLHGLLFRIAPNIGEIPTVQAGLPGVGPLERDQVDIPLPSLCRQRRVVHDGSEPGAEAALVAEVVKVDKCAEHGILDKILGILMAR